MMTKQMATQLAELFDEVENEFPDKSTEFVLEVTTDRARSSGIKPDCDVSDITEAIYSHN